MAYRSRGNAFHAHRAASPYMPETDDESTDPMDYYRANGDAEAEASEYGVEVARPYTSETSTENPSPSKRRHMHPAPGGAPASPAPSPGVCGAAAAAAEPNDVRALTRLFNAETKTMILRIPVTYAYVRVLTLDVTLASVVQVVSLWLASIALLHVAKMRGGTDGPSSTLANYVYGVATTALEYFGIIVGSILQVGISYATDGGGGGGGGGGKRNIGANADLALVLFLAAAGIAIGGWGLWGTTREGQKCTDGGGAGGGGVQATSDAAAAYGAEYVQ
jgi:hypothetical protein